MLTGASFSRQPILAEPETAEIILDALHSLERDAWIQLEAAVVMPDHFHFVAKLASGTLSELMQLFKGRTSRQINTLLNREGAFWDPQFHDHAVREEEELREVITYCLHNPVRAGLVKDFHHYPHGIAGTMCSFRESFPPKPKKIEAEASPTKTAWEPDVD